MKRFALAISLLFLLCSQVFGVEYYPTTAQEIHDQIEAAGSGDIVHVPAGDWTMPHAVTVQAGGNVIGAGKTTTVIRGVLIADMLGGAGISISGLTVNLTAQTLGVLFRNGGVTLTNMHVQGPVNAAGVNNLTIASSSSALAAVLTNVSSDNSAADCISFTAGNDILGAASSGTLLNCSATQPGAAAIDNCLTTHASFPIVDTDGVYDGGTNQKAVVIAASDSSLIDLVGTTVTGHVECHSLTRCRVVMTGVVDDVVNLLGVDAYMDRCWITGDTSSISAIGLDGSNIKVESCWLEGIYNVANNAIIGSAITTGTLSILNTHCHNCWNCYNFANAGNITTLTMKNCTEGPNVNGWGFTWSTAPASFVKGYNVFASDRNNYGAAGTGDLFGVMPQYNSGKFPASGGNVDGNGDPSVSLTSNLDIYGRPRLTGGTICRGPAELPRRSRIIGGGIL